MEICTVYTYKCKDLNLERLVKELSFLFKMLSCVKITTCVDILRTTVTHCTLAPCMVSVSELLGTVKKMFKNVFLSQQFRLR